APDARVPRKRARGARTRQAGVRTGRRTPELMPEVPAAGPSPPWSRVRLPELEWMAGSVAEADCAAHRVSPWRVRAHGLRLSRYPGRPWQRRTRCVARPV